MVHRLSCPVAHGILVPQPGIEPGSPALEAGFLTTGQPGKSQYNHTQIYSISTDLESRKNSRDNTLLTKVCIVKAKVFSVVIYGCGRLSAEGMLSNCGAGEDF